MNGFVIKHPVKELEMRIDTQKQTLSARDESIKKLLEMLQTKGEGKEEEARVHQQMQMVAQKQVVTLNSNFCSSCLIHGGDSKVKVNIINICIIATVFINSNLYFMLLEN